MSCRSPSSFAIAAALAATASLSCQQAPGDAALRSALANAHSLSVVDGALHAAGPSYKASFADGALTYVPALGRLVERDLPFTFRLESIRRGEAVVMAASTGAPPEATRDGDVVTLPRDLVTERYEPRADGIEQSFVFAGPLPGNGDLVVSGRIETELTPAVTEDGRLRFSCEGGGGVAIGDVVGIDAAGRRSPGTARLCGDRLELTLPGAFVAAASFPLVLDPLIGTTFAVTTADDSQPDCAYDHDTARWLVVWQRRFSLTDVDIYGIRIGADSGAPIGSMFVIDSGLEASTRPRVAGIAGVNRFLVTYQRASSPFGPYGVQVVAVDAAGTNVNAWNSFLTGYSDVTTPCVSGEATEQANGGLVVFVAPNSIALARFIVPTTGPPSMRGSVGSTAE